ncbi:branched-chain amino acid ABC transporter permease [Aeromicrobium sp.]|uniref:branched-chain amino acid ABC transporter permease n=1 Tax=Aeromicrobium sp. TaxID=1871063 RepID=UPI0025C63C70|nr:branched-chain amino acid ABC transporter permease [Aeromicrobium sp.]MCK5892587.1 branched-chain amino acid ABC transporter permease [Aeromicrobium sp.]
MSIDMAYQTVVSAAVVGVIYSLIALGYVVVYRASRVFNFLQAQFLYFGALLFITLWGGDSLATFALALVATTIVVGIGGAALYALVIHRTAGQPHWIQMLLTMFLGIAGLNIAQLVWGSDPRFLSAPGERVNWTLPGGAVISRVDVVILVGGVLLWLALYWLLTVSPMGVRLRATAENSTLSAYSGMPLTRWFGVAWAIAAAVGVLAGVSFAMRVPVDPTITEIGLMAFPAAMIGGMDSVKGCLVGAMILALVQQFAAVLWDVQTSIAAGFAVVLLVLMIRPRGLYGSPIVDRV